MKPILKILIVEHDAHDLELIRTQLKKGEFDFIAEVATNEKDYVYALSHVNPDIILSDFSFPSFDGLSAFLLRQKKSPETPFIFISGVIGEEKAVELIRNGVTDYVLKDKMFTLNPKIKRALEELQLRRQRKEAEEILSISEKRLSRAQELGHMGSWVFNAHSNSVLLSDEACAIYGFDGGQNATSFKDWVSLIHPEDSFAAQKLKESLVSRSEFSINCRVIRKTGFIRSIYIEGRPEFDLFGDSIGVYGIVQDVTKTKMLEQSLVKERRLRQGLVTAAVINAQENERLSIAKELIDNLNHVLGAAKMYVELAQVDEEKRYVLLDRSSGYIMSVIETIRTIAKSLSGPGAEEGLFGCIKSLIADTEKVYPLSIIFFKDSIIEANLTQEMQVNIFRIIQAQISNIIRHSKATRVIIKLGLQKSTITLLVMDDGQGTEMGKNMEGLGLKNIRTRAELHDGTATVVSFPEKGFELKVTMFLNDNLSRMLTVN